MIIETSGQKPIWDKYDDTNGTVFDITTVSNGFTNAFVMTYNDLRKVCLYTLGESPLQEKIFGNPASCIQNILLFPFKIDVTTAKKGNPSFAGYNINTVEVYEYAKRRYIELDMGKIKIQGESFSDYTGYASAQIYFPYLGFVDYNLNDIIDKEISFKLYVDLKNGYGTYVVYAKDYYRNSQGVTESYQRAISTHSTRIGVEIPAGQSDAGVKALDFSLKALQIGAQLLGGLTMPNPTTTTVSTKTLTSSKRNEQTGRMRKETELRDTEETISTRSTNKQGVLVDSFTNAISAIENSRAYASTDRLGATEDLRFMPNIIQIVIRKPKLFAPTPQYNAIFGRPLGETKILSTLTGYTVCSSVRLTSIDSMATSVEIDMIKSELLEGVIL